MKHRSVAVAGEHCPRHVRGRAEHDVAQPDAVVTAAAQLHLFAGARRIAQDGQPQRQARQVSHLAGAKLARLDKLQKSVCTLRAQVRHCSRVLSDDSTHHVKRKCQQGQQLTLTRGKRNMDSIYA